MANKKKTEPANKIGLNDQHWELIEYAKAADQSLLDICKELEDTYGLSISASTLCRKIQERAENEIVPVTMCKPKFPPVYYFILKYDKGLSYEEIALITRRAVSTVKYHLYSTAEAPSKVREDYFASKAFSKNKDTALEFKQAQMINAITDEKIEAMSGKELVDSALKLEPAIRTIRGEASSYIGIAGMDRELAELDEEEARLRKAIDITPEKVIEFEDEEELREMEIQIKRLEGK